MIIKCYVDYSTRQIQVYDKTSIFAVHQDYAADIIRMDLKASSFSDVGINLETASKKIIYRIDPGNNSSSEDPEYSATIISGKWADSTKSIYQVDWKLPYEITGDTHHVIFALNVKSLTNSTVNVSWFSLTKDFNVVPTLIDTDQSGAEDPDEIATNAEQIAILQNQMALTSSTLTSHGNRLDSLESLAQSHTELIDGLQHDITDIRSKIAEIVSEDEYEALKENVIMGYGPRLYPVGTVLTIKCTSGAPYQYIDMIVIDHDKDKDISAPAAHTMTLMMKSVIYGIQVDSPEAAFYFPQGLSAGTKNFTIPNYDTAYGGNKTYQFVLTKNIPAGGQLFFSWAYNTQAADGKVSTYESSDSRTAIETVSVSEGSGGTSLGTIDGSAENTNHIHRARYGSNNYEESGVRQWANSGLKKGEWWHPQTNYDRPVSYADTRDGFLTYLDQEFVNILCNVEKKNRTNSVYDEKGITQAYSTIDRVFMMSNEELGFSSESGINTGTVYKYFENAEDVDRIAYDISNNSTARYYWMRTPLPSYASGVRGVDTTGALHSGGAYNGYGARFDCVI